MQMRARVHVATETRREAGREKDRKRAVFFVLVRGQQMQQIR